MHRILADPRVAVYERPLGKNTLKRAAEAAIGNARGSEGAGDYEAIVVDAVARLESESARILKPVVNATGIIVHTNLGRAPLSEEALAEIARVGAGYSNLEFDLVDGGRGAREASVATQLRDLCGAEDALIVNNCAAAVLLVLDTLAKGREVVVARNALVEIGGGFRVPDVLERSGSTLVEAGATNRVHLRDFERALSPRTALILHTHPSNYRIEGFTHEPSVGEIAALGRRAGVVVAEDLGSGALVDLAEYGAEHERTVAEALDDGVDLVTFSGDKLLGGPQAGIVVGRAHLIARMRNNPLMRALRVGKLTLAALSATLLAYREGAARSRIPIYRMLATPIEELRTRAERYCDAIRVARIVESDAYAGGGALPQRRIASIAVAIPSNAPNRLAAALRAGNPPIVARVTEGEVLLDLRTINPNEDEAIIAALAPLSS